MENIKNIVKIIGAGLAGSEAALQLAKRGINVKLYEMRPKKTTGAHTGGDCAEFVCSNSLGSADITNASGLLKAEMEILGGELIKIAKDNSVPAGNALAISREDFAKAVTDKILNNPNIELVREEVTQIPDGNVIISSGPLTSDNFAKSIQEFTKTEHLHFFDAIAPIVEVDSINFEKAFWASRYDKGEASYINCPMSKEEYEKFYDILINAPRIEQHDIDKDTKFFESCLPVEVLASRGKDTLRFGPMKPVGLIDKRTGEENYAVVQLRQDNSAKTIFNVELNGKKSSAKVTSRSVASDESHQEFVSNVIGNNDCYAHVECDAIISDKASVTSDPKITANHIDARLVHEATIGKIAGEQLIKLMTLGLSKKKAEETIINGFLK